MIITIFEIIITIFSPTSLLLIGCKNPNLRKLGFTIGLLIQVPWLYISYKSDFYSLLINAIIFAVITIYNFYKKVLDRINSFVYI